MLRRLTTARSWHYHSARQAASRARGSSTCAKRWWPLPPRCSSPAPTAPSSAAISPRRCPR
eukprot:36622-Eustigmatos_ZCMA.PRE.1